MIKGTIVAYNHRSERNLDELLALEAEYTRKWYKLSPYATLYGFQHFCEIPEGE